MAKACKNAKTAHRFVPDSPPHALATAVSGSSTWDNACRILSGIACLVVAASAQNNNNTRAALSVGSSSTLANSSKFIDLTSLIGAFFALTRTCNPFFVHTALHSITPGARQEDKKADRPRTILYSRHTDTDGRHSSGRGRHYRCTVTRTSVAGV